MNVLASLQVDADVSRLGGRPALLERKWRRMARSPFAFLRGASALWAAAMARESALLSDLPGEGALVGDLHLENVGLFRAADGVTFHVNDFDETFDGPFAFDVLRLLTSTLLARGELNVSPSKAVDLARGLLDGHGAGLRGEPVRAPAFVTALVDEVNALPLAAVLKKKVDASGRLVRAPDKTPDVAPEVVQAVPAALEAWRAGVGLDAKTLEVLDVTGRLAGTGSLGVLRLLVLTRGDQAPWLLEVKEVRGSPASRAAPSAERLVEVVRRALPRPPATFGASRLSGAPVVIMRLSPKEDKLGVDEVPADQLDAYVPYVGALAGEVHRRVGASMSWTAAQQARLLDAANRLAELHEQAFADFCAAVIERFGESG